MKDLLNRTRMVAMAAFLSAAFIISGCSDDSSISNPETGDTFTIEGRVTDDASYAKRGDVDDAQVSAEDLDENGRRSGASEQETTDDNGAYRLEVSGNAEMYVVTATKGTFESSTLVMVDGRASVQAPAMNAESHATAEVYTEAKRQDSDTRGVSAADVALHMNTDLASSIETGAASASEVAAAIRTAVEAEASYRTRFEGASQVDLNAEARLEGEHFVQLQSNLAAGADVEASWQTFLTAMVETSANSTADASSSAQARQVSSIAIDNMTVNMDAQARFALMKNAAIAVAHATDLAVTARFNADSEWQTNAGAAAQAGASLRTAIPDASSESDIEAAWTEYETDIEGIITARLSLGSIVQANLSASIDSLKGSFSTQIQGSTNADTIVDAHQSFKTSLRSELQSSVGSSLKAEAAAEIIALVIIN